MGKLTQSIQELVGVIMVENGLHPDCELALISFGLDFVRMMQQDAKTFQVPDRDITKTFYFEDQGYNSVALPANMIDIISVGVQVGRYIKGLALNTRETNMLPQPTRGLVSSDTQGTSWYWGGLYGLGAYGGSGSMGLSSFGNGQDFGDYQIDYKNRRIFTSNRYPYKNIVLHYYTNCITPSCETNINPWFISSFKDFCMWKYHRSRNVLALSQSFKQDFAGAYEYQLTQQNKIDRTTVVKIIERNLGYRHGRS